MEAKLSVNFLFHRINGRIDTHQGHDAERNNGYRDACAEFIAPDRTESKGKNIGLVSYMYWNARLI